MTIIVIKMITARLVKFSVIITVILCISVVVLSCPWALKVKNGNTKDKQRKTSPASENAITRFLALQWLAVSVCPQRGHEALHPSARWVNLTNRSHSRQAMCLLSAMTGLLRSRKVKNNILFNRRVNDTKWQKYYFLTTQLV